MSEILGGPDIYLREGEMINLTCVISGTNAPPKNIFWYHQEKVSSVIQLIQLLTNFR